MANRLGQYLTTTIIGLLNTGSQSLLKHTTTACPGILCNGIYHFQAVSVLDCKRTHLIRNRNLFTPFPEMRFWAERKEIQKGHHKLG